MTKKAGKEQSDLLYESILTLKDLDNKPYKRQKAVKA